MTLPRYVAATRPRSSQIVLEPAAELTELVRSELPLPRRSGIKVRPVDGRAGTAELRESSADVVILDAFDGARVPADLVTAEYFASVSRALTDGGWFLLNLTDRAPFAWTRRVVAALRTVFPELMVSAEPATLRGRRFGNLLVVASRAPCPGHLAPEPSRVLGGAVPGARRCPGQQLARRRDAVHRRRHPAVAAPPGSLIRPSPRGAAPATSGRPRSDARSPGTSPVPAGGRRRPSGG